MRYPQSPTGRGRDGRAFPEPKPPGLTAAASAAANSPGQEAPGRTQSPATEVLTPRRRTASPARASPARASPARALLALTPARRPRGWRKAARRSLAGLISVMRPRKTPGLPQAGEHSPRAQEPLDSNLNRTDVYPRQACQNCAERMTKARCSWDNKSLCAITKNTNQRCVQQLES